MLLTLLVWNQLDESGNIYLRARYYNPRIGQFIQVDSYRGSSTSLESQNRYLYGLNNPYRYVDRDGNVAIDANELGSGGNKTGSGVGRNTVIAGRNTVIGGGGSTIGSGVGRNTVIQDTDVNNPSTSVTTTKVVEVEPCPYEEALKNIGSKALDALQFLLDWGGVFTDPVTRMILDFINALIYLARGEVLNFVIC